MSNIQGFVSRSLLTTTVLATAAMYTAMPAMAQSATSLNSVVSSAADTGMTPSAGMPGSGEEGPQQEIVVTGLSSKQSMQEAPVAVSVFTQSAIKDARINNTEDLVKNAPNISFAQSQGAGVTMITVRGIAQVQNGQSPVAVVIDGVQQMSYQQFSQDLYNVAQIEVLRGPQGDLWGRNAISGAIIINTIQPTNETHISGSASIGNGNAYKGQVSISGPIVSDKLFFDVSGSDSNFGGLLKNYFRGDTVDHSHDISGRAHIKAILADNLTIDLRGGVDQLHGGGNNYQYQPTNYDPNKPCFLDTSNPFTFSRVDANYVSRRFCSNNPGREDRFMADASLRIAYETPFATITNVVGFLRLTDYVGSDAFPYSASTSLNAPPGTESTQSQFTRQTSWEDEFRITSSSKKRLRWMVGAYYLGVRDYLSRSLGFDKGLGQVKITDVPQFNDLINPTTSYIGSADRNHDIAVFGHIAFDITKTVTAEFGYRYDWNSLATYVDPISTSGNPVGCASMFTVACERRASFNQGQPKFTLTYHPNRNLTFFTSYGLGFRSGSFNQSGTAVAAGFSYVQDIDRAEIAKTFEAGFKSQWLDGKLSVNASFFNTQDRDPSYILYIPSIAAQVFVNVDKVHLIGGDIDINYNILPGLNVFANGGYTHSSITKYAIDPTVYGNHAPAVPEFNANLGIQYRHPITDKISGFGRFDVHMEGKEYYEPENISARNAYNLYNVQFGLETPSRNMSLVFFVRNLTDKVYNAYFVPGGFPVPAQPRTFGAEFRFNF